MVNIRQNHNTLQKENYEGLEFEDDQMTFQNPDFAMDTRSIATRSIHSSLRSQRIGNMSAKQSFYTSGGFNSQTRRRTTKIKSIRETKERRKMNLKYIKDHRKKSWTDLSMLT